MGWCGQRGGRAAPSTCRYASAHFPGEPGKKAQRHALPPRKAGEVPSFALAKDGGGAASKASREAAHHARQPPNRHPDEGQDPVSNSPEREWRALTKRQCPVNWALTFVRVTEFCALVRNWRMPALRPHGTNAPQPPHPLAKIPPSSRKHLNSSAFPAGSRRKNVPCSPGSPAKRT